MFSCRYLKQVMTALAVVLAVQSPAWAGPQFITYEGYVVDNFNTPVSSSKQFKFQITDPSGTCVIYEQTQTIVPANGHFSAKVGAGVATHLGASEFAKLFVNSGTLTCTSGTYNPVTTDSRRLYVYLDDGGFQNVANIELGSTPFAASAGSSESISGFTSQQILKFDNSTNTSTLTSSDYSELVSLLLGSSSKYMPSGATTGTLVPNLAIDPSVPAAGQFWYQSGNLKYYDGSSVKTISTSGASSAITSLTGDVIATGPGAAAATVQANSITSGKIADAAISTSKIADSAVTDAKLAGSIARSKLATGTANHFLVNNASGDFTSVSCGSNQGPFYNGSAWSCASYIRDGGNSPGANMTIGNLGGFNLNLVTNNTTRLSILSSGEVGIGTASPSVGLDLSGRSDALRLPAGTNAQRPGSSDGLLRYNTSTSKVEVVEAGTWKDVVTGGGASLPKRAIVKLSAAKTFTNSTNYVVSWDALDQGDAGIWSGGTPEALVVPAGVSRARICGNIQFDPTSGTTSYAYIFMTKNNIKSPGLPVVQALGNGASYYGIHNFCTALLSVTPGDSFRITIYHVGSGTQKIGSVDSWFSFEEIK